MEVKTSRVRTVIAYILLILADTAGSVLYLLLTRVLPIEKILAILMEARVRHDSTHHLIHRSTDYALSSSQINAALERYFIEKDAIVPSGEDHETAPELSWWHALNIFNQDLKPAECVIPSIISQSFGLGHVFWNTLSNKL